MSGGCGSGSRVNNSTMHAIKEHQLAQQIPDEHDAMQETDEHDAMQQESDIDPYDSGCDRELPSDEPPVEQHDSNVLENATLDDWTRVIWTVPPGTVQITTLYDINTHNCMQNPHAELARTIVKDTFFGGFDTGSLDECLQKLQDCSCFRILQLEGIKNLPAHQMQEAYKSAYGICDDEVRTTYHGSDKVDVISKEGFRGAASERAKYGKGIYTGTNVWEAISYCPPDPKYVVQVLIVKNLVGLHAVGSQDQKDFGTHPNGRAYSTLTNPEETIMCSKHESQLCPIGIVTLQYRIDFKPTVQHQAFVAFYHHRLVQRINDTWAKQAPAAGAVAAAGAGGAGGPPSQWVDKEHCFWGVGQEVKIGDFPDDRYIPYLGCTGVIRKIAGKDTGKNTSFMFFVQVALDNQGNPVDAQVVNDNIATMNTGKFNWVHGMHRCCLVYTAAKYFSRVYGDAVGTTAGAAVAAAEAAWVGGVGAPAAPAAGGAGGAAAGASAAPLQWVDKPHHVYVVGREVIITKPYVGKYLRYVGFTGVVEGSMARGGEFIIFVKPTHDQHGNPVSDDTLSGIIQMHKGCFNFLKGPDRAILGCLPCRQSHLDTPPSADKAEAGAGKRPADGQPDDADDAAGAKKARHDDGTGKAP